jgi:hypothetical protein
MSFISLPYPSLPCYPSVPSQVASYDLFRDEAIHCELHLIVCQSTDHQHAIVLGCRYMYYTHVHVHVHTLQCTSSLLFYVHAEDLAIVMMNIERVM